ncbi:UPF0058 family protein [Salinigranum salinum]|jgi:hypothetical protein|uniref:UPF0058 family protein n=1 Tax=Salinigranum salinum TaxID=1364937 RepID=UPI001260481A|nr:UPF0058 family protein [Salinigranum salinum]
MKKQELIHLHGLLSEVRAQMEAWEDDELEMSGYESMGVRPTSIHRSKTDHKAAVFEIANGITTAMEEAEADPVAPKAD